MKYTSPLTAARLTQPSHPLLFSAFGLLPLTSLAKLLLPELHAPPAIFERNVFANRFRCELSSAIGSPGATIAFSRSRLRCSTSRYCISSEPWPMSSAWMLCGMPSL